MQDSTRNQLTRSMLALLAVAGPACDSGMKQIGALDDGTGATETNDDGNPGDGDPGDGDPQQEEGETGEACMGDGDPEAEPTECAAAQEVEAEATVTPVIEQDMLHTCAANVEPSDGGYLVMLTHCSDSQGDPQVDRELLLTGDWPEPELADGDQPLTEVRFITRNPDDHGYGASWVIMRPIGQERISLLAFSGTELLINPSYISPLSLALDRAGCMPDTITCTAQTQHQEYRIGFAVGFGCFASIVTDNTMLTDLGDEDGTAYDVLVGFAKTHECEPDGDFYELQLGIVGKTI